MEKVEYNFISPEQNARYRVINMSTSINTLLTRINHSDIGSVQNVSKRDRFRVEKPWSINIQSIPWKKKQNFEWKFPFSRSISPELFNKREKQGRREFLGSMLYVPRDETFEKLFADVTSIVRFIWIVFDPIPPPHIEKRFRFLLWKGWKKGWKKKAIDGRIFKQMDGIQRSEYLNIGWQKWEYLSKIIDTDIDLAESTHELLTIAEGKYWSIWVGF